MKAARGTIDGPECDVRQGKRRISLTASGVKQLRDDGILRMYHIDMINASSIAVAFNLHRVSVLKIIRHAGVMGWARAKFARRIMEGRPGRLELDELIDGPDIDPVRINLTKAEIEVRRVVGIRQLYHDDRLTAQTIGEVFGLHRTTIHEIMRKADAAEKAGTVFPSSL